MTTFEYLSVFISIVLGLAVVRLLGGLVAVVTRSGGRPYWVYTAWLSYFVLWLPYFWWFTLDWREQEVWTFLLFFFVVAYAMLNYALVVVLVPNPSTETLDYEAVFFRVRRPFFRLFTVVLLVDMADSILKGPENIAGLGPTYFPLVGALVLGHIVASMTDSRWYHGAWVSISFLVFILFSLNVWADVFSSI